MGFDCTNVFADNTLAVFLGSDLGRVPTASINPQPASLDVLPIGLEIALIVFDKVSAAIVGDF